MKTIAILLVTAALISYTYETNASDTAPSDNDTVLVKLNEALDDYWVVETKFAPTYPRSAIKRKQQGCATVGYFVETDGSTSGHWVIASHPERIFDRSAIEANKKFAYTPGVLNSGRQPVMTINTFTYKLAYGGVKPGAEIHDAMAKLCKEAATKLIMEKYASTL